MPTTSTLEQQAADIAYYTLNGLANGQWAGQYSKGQQEGMAAAILCLAVGLNNLRVAVTALAASNTAAGGTGTITAAQYNAIVNATTPAGTNGSYTLTATAIGSQWIGTDVALANLNGTYVIATQLP